MHRLRTLFAALRRSLRWGWALRHNYEWDYYALLEMEVLKLKELLHNFENHGYHDEGCETYAPKMKSLRLAIKLGDLLLTDNYQKFYNLHYAKWGAVEMGTEEILDGPGKGNFRCTWTRDGKPHKPSPEERHEFIEAIEADLRVERQHRRRFYAIIAKYGPSWWD